MTDTQLVKTLVTRDHPNHYCYNPRGRIRHTAIEKYSRKFCPGCTECEKELKELDETNEN